jgi:hypothetical protein
VTPLQPRFDATTLIHSTRTSLFSALATAGLAGRAHEVGSRLNERSEQGSS